MDSINNFLHTNFGAYKYRPSIKVRTDAFYEYLPNQNQKDQQVISRLSNTIVELTDICFKHCVDPNHKYYTYTENNCVESCVKKYFQGFQEIVIATTDRIKQQKIKIKKLQQQAKINQDAE